MAIISRESPADAARRVTGAPGYSMGVGGQIQRNQTGAQGLRAAPQMSMSSLPEMNTFDKWALQDAVSKPVAGARGLTASQRQLGYEMARAPIEDALKIGEMNVDLAKTNVAAANSDRLMAAEEGRNSVLGESSIAEVISGLRGGLARPGTPIVRTGTSYSDGTMGTPAAEEEERAGMKNGGVIGNVKKDTGKDKIPVAAREGEYFLNPETVAHIGGGDYSQGLRSLNALVREATGKEPGPTPVGKSGRQGFNRGGFVDDFGDITLGNKNLPFSAQQAVSEVATSPQGRRTIANQFAAAQAEAIARNAPKVEAPRLNDAYIQRTIDATNARRAAMPAATAPTAPQVAAAAPKPPGIVSQGLRILGSAPVTGAMLMAHSENAGEAAEDNLRPNRAPGSRSVGPYAPDNAQLVGPGDPYTPEVVGHHSQLNMHKPRAAEPTTKVEPAAPTSNFVPVQYGKITAPETTLTDLLPGSREEVAARHLAADKVRGQWQAMAPDGLRGANQGAVDLYNKEQTIRGTGVKALSNNSFTDSGLPVKPQYVGADGRGTNDWTDTSEYRDAVVRNLSSNDPNLRRQGLAAATQLAQRDAAKQPAPSTGDPMMDRLIAQFGPKDAASIYKAQKQGGGGGDGNAPKGASYSEQSQRIEDLVGKGAMPEIQQAQANLVQNMVKSGQMSPQEAQAAVQQGMFMPELARAYQLRNLLAENGQGGEALSGAATWGGLGGLAAGGLTLLATRNPALAAKVGASFGAGTAGLGAVRGFEGGVGNFDKTAPLDQLMFDENMGNALKQDEKTGNYTINGAVVPKSFVQKNYRLFGLSSPPQ